MEHFYISFTMHISRSHGKNLPLSITSSHVLKPTLLQLYHRTSLIKHPNITSLHHNYNTCSILTLHHSNITSHYLSIYRFIQIFNFHICHLLLFHSLKDMSHILSPNYYFFPAMSRLIQDRNQSMKTQFSAPYAPTKLTEEFSKTWQPTCYDKNCNARCHQACNGLSISQTRHVKRSGCSITWKCPQYGTGIAKIIIPPAPVHELPNRSSAIGKSCFVCRNPIHTHYADLAYHCVNPSCNNCHVAAMCSRFTNPRGTARAHALSTLL